MFFFGFYSETLRIQDSDLQREKAKKMRKAKEITENRENIERSIQNFFLNGITNISPLRKTAQSLTFPYRSTRTIENLNARFSFNS